MAEEQGSAGRDEPRQDQSLQENTPGMATTYDPRSVEERWYQYWLDEGFFHGTP